MLHHQGGQRDLSGMQTCYVVEARGDVAFVEKVGRGNQVPCRPDERVVRFGIRPRPAQARCSLPVAWVILENLEAGANIDNIMEWFDGLDREQVKSVIDFAARSLDTSARSG